MDRDKAMLEFVCTINRLCPLFLPYLEAHCRHLRNSHDDSEVQLGEQQSPPSSKIHTPPPSPAFSTNEERSFILQNDGGIPQWETNSRSVVCSPIALPAWDGGPRRVYSSESTMTLHTAACPAPAPMVLLGLHVFNQYYPHPSSLTLVDRIFQAWSLSHLPMFLEFFVEKGFCNEIRNYSSERDPPALRTKDAFSRTGIRMALNAQTREQFEQYAMEHFPDDVTKRQELIAHLQDCHFREYVAYIQQQYALARQRQLTDKASNSIDSPASPTQDAEAPHTSSDLSPQTRVNGNGPSVKVSGEFVEKLMDSMEKAAGIVASQTNSDAVHHADTQLPRPPNPQLVADESTADHLSDEIIPNSQAENVDTSAPEEHFGNEQTASPGALIRTPTMWTRSEIDEFKESLADTKDAIVQVGCGEVITIRVPAYPAGSSIVWEFATDSYDIGFGLFFEWASPESEVHQQQQPDFPVDHDKSITHQFSSLTFPAASEQVSMSPAYPPPLVDEIVPVYRRNSHQEIYCGSHIYPGLGTYLFKFDNSYSLWRSKMLYYRVYYT
ncbi:Emp24/gp25L/p24 family protein, partial [Opisthorchis viverrini]